MMKGKLMVDGLDAFTEYGIFVERYGYKALIQQPSFKKLTSTEWPEYDGEEVDLTSPVLDTRSLSIQFCITDKNLAEDFFDYLATDGAYHNFYFADLKRTYKLRMTSNGSLSSKIRLGKLSLTFSQDDCEIPNVDLLATSIPKAKQSGYEIDSMEISRFGTYVLNGTDDNIRKAPNVRENLSVSTKNKSGIGYDGKVVFFKAKDVTLNLFIHAPNIDAFWQRWDALFSLLMQPGSRSFYFGGNLSVNDCYYKSNSVSKFDILRNGHVWCEFSVTLAFIATRPIGGVALGTEDGNMLGLESGGALGVEDAANFRKQLNTKI